MYEKIDNIKFIIASKKLTKALSFIATFVKFSVSYPQGIFLFFFEGKARISLCLSIIDQVLSSS